ncbi:MAG: penicillin-binding protein activator LpoB [Treponema sp.]
MRKIVILFVLVALSSCVSVKVDRVDSKSTVDLSGYWNDTDVRLVCKDLIDKCLASSRIAGFEAKNNRLPVIMVGRFKNDSTEHIDTSIITEKMSDAISNSGLADFVADRVSREELREERKEQNKAGYTTEESIKNLSGEIGADFILQGSVKTIVDKVDNKTVRTYYVSVQLINLETNIIAFKGFNDSIKKFIKTRTPKL